MKIFCKAKQHWEINNGKLILGAESDEFLATQLAKMTARLEAEIRLEIYDQICSLDLVKDAHDDLVNAEAEYHILKANYEIAMAEKRIELSRASSPTGKNYTIGERDDLALLANREAHQRIGAAEAVVKANRANVARLRVQVDIARSIGTSVRTGMDT